MPPRYASTDFTQPRYWSLRGKLDVPKERFIHYPLAERDVDASPVIGWAGWDHLQQARALATYYMHCKEVEGWDTARLIPLLLGIAELVPWLLQWHNDIDSETGERLGNFYEEFLREEARSAGCQVSDLRAWEPPKRQVGSRKTAGRKRA